MFKTYSEAEDKNVLLGDSHTTVVTGTRDMELKFSFEKTVMLKEVLHTPEIRKNLVLGYLLNRARSTQTFGGELYTLTKNNIFVGKGYSTDGMFKLNVEANKFFLLLTCCILLTLGILDFVMLISTLSKT